MSGSTSLHKSLTTFGLFSLGFGAMISSGLFILPAIAFTESGKWILLAYTLAGICMVPALVTKLELTSAMPRAGGAFFYITRIFGAPVGLVVGIADWFSISLKSAFALVGIGVFGSLVFPSFGEVEFRLVAVGACLVFTAFNLLSVKSASRSQNIMVVFLLATLAAFLLVGYRRMDFTHFTVARELDWRALVGTTGMVFIAYGGITKIATAVEEVKDPRRMLVPGLVAAFVTVQALYLLVVFVVIGVLPGDRLAHSLSPLTDAASAFFENRAASVAATVVIALSGMLAFFTTANAGILSASRVPMAMSRDRLLPQSIGKVSGRGTPVTAVLVTAGFMIAVIIGLDVRQLAKVASLFLMLVFFLENLGLIVIRASRFANYRPIYRAPLFPYLQILGVCVYGVLIVSQGAVPLIIASGFVAVVLLWYLLYARKGWRRTSAFVAMVRKITGSELAEAEDYLEDELLSILMERDQIQEDRFDSLVRAAPVLDYDHTITRAELFGDVARELAERHGLDPVRLATMYEERERDTPTLLYPGVAVPHAVPHVVIEGESLFDIVLARNKYGIKWDEETVVYTAFCLIGSRDQRTFHLQALMSIAQTLQDPDFLTAWHKARSVTGLRTTMLLARRRRIAEEGGLS